MSSEVTVYLLAFAHLYPGNLEEVVVQPPFESIQNQKTSLSFAYLYQMTPTPFVQTIPGCIYPGRLIFISGIPSSNPTRFTIYLQNGMSYEPDYIWLAFDVRFNFGGNKNILVCNYRLHGIWGKERRFTSYFPFTPKELHFPFIPDAPFDMIILVDTHQFKVAVNNQHILAFHHRLQPLSNIDTLRIDGDVTLTHIQLH